MKKILLLTVALLSIVTMAAFANGQKEDAAITKLVVASDATWPPMEYVDVNGDMVGFDIDVLKAISEEMGIEIEVRNTAWDGIFAGLKNGAYDAVCSSVTITEERKASMDFTTPYINAGQILLIQKATKGVNSLADMNGMAVGVQNGTTGDFVLDDYPKIIRKAYDEVGFAVEDLMNGQVQGVVCDSVVAADYVLNNDAYKGKLMIVGEPFTEEYFGIAVNKGNDKVLAILNDGLAAITASGKLDELINTWLR